MDRRARGRGHPVHPLAPRDAGLEPPADVRAFIELVGIFRRGRFDVVHTHNPKPGLMGRIAARVAGVPIVVNTVHGFWASPDGSAWRRLPVMALEWIGARFSDAELIRVGKI